MDRLPYNSIFPLLCDCGGGSSCFPREGLLEASSRGQFDLHFDPQTALLYPPISALSTQLVEPKIWRSHSRLFLSLIPTSDLAPADLASVSLAPAQRGFPDHPT